MRRLTQNYFNSVLCRGIVKTSKFTRVFVKIGDVVKIKVPCGGILKEEWGAPEKSRFPCNHQKNGFF